MFPRYCTGRSPRLHISSSDHLPNWRYRPPHALMCGLTIIPRLRPAWVAARMGWARAAYVPQRFDVINPAPKCSTTITDRQGWALSWRSNLGASDPCSNDLHNFQLDRICHRTNLHESGRGGGVHSWCLGNCGPATRFLADNRTVHGCASGCQRTQRYRPDCIYAVRGSWLSDYYHPSNHLCLAHHYHLWPPFASTALAK